MPAVVLLAVIQGITEFLPVSSSGHLVLFGHLLGVSEQGLTLDVVLHAGTLVVLLVHYRRELFGLVTRLGRAHPDSSEYRDLFGSLLVATLLTGVVGILLKDRIEEWFSRSEIAAVCLMVTGFVLLSRLGRDSGKKRSIGLKLALLVGLAQTVAMMPGISRSGSTIVAGLWLGLEPIVAARFSFLLAIPAIGGAVLLELGKLTLQGGPALDVLAIGFGVSVLASWVGLKLVLRFVERGRFSLFGFYCLALGGLALLFLRMGT